MTLPDATEAYVGVRGFFTDVDNEGLDDDGLDGSGAVVEDGDVELFEGDDGRLKQSATTFEAPGTCRISVVNSAMKERCRDCLGDLSVALPIAPQSGLWSVHTTKFLPSRWQRK